MTMRMKLFALAAAGLGAVIVARPALAQADNNAIETVVVTGSRIPTTEADSPNPVVSIGRSQIENSGTLNITDYLKIIPALVGSINDLQESGLNSTVTNAGASLSGLNLLDLRNLGFDRTLVLEDSQRIVSSSAGDAAVDINTIPITLIDRVDVVTGGSSAVYGADGVSGVVNFIMKHDLEGIDARVQGDAPQDGGNNKYLAAASIGHNFDDNNGNIEFSVENSYESRLNYTQRDFTSVGGAIWFVPNPANPNGTISNLPAFIPAKNGTLWASSATGAISSLSATEPSAFGLPVPDYHADGTAYNAGTILDGEFGMGGDGAPLSPAFLGDLGPVEHRTIVQLTGDEQFSQWFKLSGEFRFSHVDTKSASLPSFNELATITSDNPFLAPSVQNAILNNGTASPQPYGLGFVSSYPYLTPGLMLQERVSRDVYRGVIGANGQLPAPDFIHDATYDIHYVYGQSEIDDVDEHNLAEDRYYAALDSVMGPHGPTCRSNLDPSAAPLSLFGSVFDDVVSLNTSLFGTTFTPGPNSGCAAYNPFVANSPQNNAAIDWMTMNTPTYAFIREQDVNGFVSFDFPQFADWGVTAKPVNFVFGGEWRSEFSKSISDPITRPVPVPGQPGVTQSLFFVAGTQPVEGQFHVSEAFGEVSVPLLADRRLARELTLDFAGRVSDYSTAGTDETWKMGAVYSLVTGLKFRATDAVAVRAPNIGELFAPLVQGFEGINDPCDPAYINQGTQYRAANCQTLENALLGPGVYTAGTTSVQQPVTLPVLIGGNQKLEPETAKTLTFGTVIQPNRIPNLTITADWYRVNIADAITALSGQTIADECVDLSTINNPYCAAVTRNGKNTAIPGSIEQVVAQEINVASYFTQGMDFTANYFIDLDDWVGDHVGSLNLHLIGNHLDGLSFTSLAGQAPVSTSNVINGGADGGPAPFWQVYLDATWTRDDWSVDYNVQWADGLLNVSRQTLISQPNNLPAKYIHTADQDIHSIQLRYQFAEGWQVYAGVNNLWYQKPAANDYMNGYPADPTGRVFYVGAQIDMDPMK